MTILHVDSSITGDASASRELSAAIVARLRAEQPDAVVIRRDLAAEPLPHLTLDALGGPDTNPALAEFLAADTVVIGSGMYNFGIPSQLKAWIDRLLIPGFTFRYGAAGPEGLVAGKRVIVAVARGGFYGADTPQAAAEHDESYLRAVFGFIGATDVEFAVAEGLKYNPDARDATIAAALAEVPLAA